MDTKKISPLLSLICSLGLTLVPGNAVEPTPPNAVTLQQEVTREWAYSLALQAASYGAPLVTMYALRQNDAIGPRAKARPNSIWRMEDISTPDLSKIEGYVTPNVNVIYGFGFMDLSQEPVIVEAPDSGSRYYMIEVVDMWTNAFAYLGGRATNYKGGLYALAGPNWKGDLPSNVQRIDCPTPWVLIQPRVHIYADGRIDLAGASRILDAIRTVGLSEYLGNPPLPAPVYNYPEPDPSNPSLSVSELSYKDPLQFWELFQLALNENPPPKDQITALLPMFKPLGIELGKTWDRTKLSPEVCEVMKKASRLIGTILGHISFGQTEQGASLPPPTIGDPGTDYKTRAVVARVGLTANTPVESIYWMYTLDSNGNPLMGTKKYTLTFTKELSFYTPGFWSLTMYDAHNNYTVPNLIDRYMLGSDSPSLKKNKDGSITIFIQHNSPGKEKESNWLPAPIGPFYLIPRVYPPKPDIIHILDDPKSWPIPAVVPLSAK